MTEFLCSSYAQLARRLMEIYRDTPAEEILSVSAGASCPDNGAVEIHRAMAKHRATCEVCAGNTKADRRISPMRGRVVLRATRAEQTR
jgi:hypothetical protein